MGQLTAEIVEVRTVSEPDRDAMYALLQATYEHTHRRAFEEDLSWKDDVIVLRDEAGAVQGFSTLRNLTVRVDGVERRVVYSGDTVIAEAYWGQRVLGRAFLGYLARKRLQKPFEPLYWMLISKGFKTYLLMANNFPEHWPRHEEPTPGPKQRLIDTCALELFGDHYSPATGVVTFPEPRGQLRRGIADVTPELVERYPRVRFFAERNPGWHKGDELVCIARMQYRMPWFYLKKAIRKLGPYQALFGGSR